MANYNENLLKLLNIEFGFPDAKAATYEKVKQFFDENSAQHVIYIEFRVSRNEKPVAKNSKFKQSQRLLYSIINARQQK